MSEFIDLYVRVAGWLLLAELPAAAILTIVSWRLARKWWPYLIPVVGAIVNTIVGACATWLAITVVFYWFAPVPNWFALFTATTLVMLPAVTFLNTGLLVYLDRRQLTSDKRRVGEADHIE